MLILCSDFDIKEVDAQRAINCKCSKPLILQNHLLPDLPKSTSLDLKDDSSDLRL
jgi:hypothetical protein